jgi:hypothetical protein
VLRSNISRVGVHTVVAAYQYAKPRIAAVDRTVCQISYGAANPRPRPNSEPAYDYPITHVATRMPNTSWPLAKWVADLIASLSAT